MAIMPWKHTETMIEKERFAVLASTGKFTISQLCEDFGISRKTGHKYLERYRARGREGLVELSRRPKSSSMATNEEVEAAILKERVKHPTWGPKKIRELLRMVHGVESPPWESTIARILSRHGLSDRRKRKPGVHRVHPEHLTESTRCNEVWTIDFKGWFVLGNGERCDPLTVCDRYSRYVIGCYGCENQQFLGTLRICKRLMRYHGKPEIIRVDNGAPFASMALGGLSALSVWWIEQGIRVEYMRPGCPQENGSHERMHKDLKAEATKPASQNMEAQRKRFDRWKQEYNFERPHESLDMAKPGDIYQRSVRRLGENDKWRYPESYIVKRVSSAGFFNYQGGVFYAGGIYAGCRMGLSENEKGITEVRYANMHLGNLDFDSGNAYGEKASIVAPESSVAKGGSNRRIKGGK